MSHGTFLGLSALLELHLSHNQLVQLEGDQLLGLHQLQLLALHHNQLEEKFQKFRLDCQPQFQDSGGSYLQHTNPATPTTGPCIYITYLHTIYTIYL